MLVRYCVLQEFVLVESLQPYRAESALPRPWNDCNPCELKKLTMGYSQLTTRLAVDEAPSNVHLKLLTSFYFRFQIRKREGYNPAALYQSVHDDR
jgi:hypothetical protein